MAKNKHLLSIIYLLLIFAGLTHISCGKKSDERLIVDTLQSLADRAEDNEIGEFLTFISVQYSDQEGRSKKEIREVLDRYLSRYQGIVIHVLENKISSLEPPLATIHVDTALSHGAAKLMRKLVRVGTRFYRFHLTMEKEEQIWRVKEASWQQIPANELYPESSRQIRKIFPDVF